MKKFIFLAFGLLVALNLGCVTVLYPTIGDNTGVSGPIAAVNTNGKAHVVETAQTISGLPNGDNAEFVSFIDQDSKGTHRLTGYQIVSTGDPFTHFHSDTYCNPDWTGCAFLDETYDSSQFNCSWAGLGTRFNFNCVGVGFLGICTTYRFQECGRGFMMANLDAVTQLINAGTPVNVNGQEGLRYDLNRNSMALSLAGNGKVLDFTLRGNYSVTAVPSKHMVILNATDPASGTNLRSFSSKLRDINSSSVQMTVTLEGVSRSFTIAGKGLNSQYEKMAAQYY